MKKLLSIFVLLFLLFVIVSCGGEETTLAPTTEAPTTEAPTTQAPITGDIGSVPEFTNVEDRMMPLDGEPDFLSGIEVNDEEDGDLTASIEVDSSELDASSIGSYTIILTVTDSDGNEVSTSYEYSVVSESEYLVETDLADINITLEDLEEGEVLKKNSPTFETRFTWTSSHENVITKDGFVRRPAVGSDPVEVTLTVKASPYAGGIYTSTRDFVFVVEPQNPVDIATKRTLDFEGTSEEYVVENSQIDLFYEENSELAYVDIESFLNMLNGAIESDIITYTMIEDHIMKIEYSSTYTDFDGETEITETYWAEIDFELNTFTVQNFDFFGGYIAETESDYGEGLNYVDATYVDGNEVTIPLGEYGFDLTIYEDGEQTLYLMPFDVANIIFMNDVYYQAYYNGDKIYGIDTFGLSSGDEEIMAQIHESSYNDKTMGQDIKMASYNGLALIMDYFYGLKPDKGYDSFYDILKNYGKSIQNGSDNQVYNRIFNLMYGMDDLHTSHVFYGYYDSRTSSGISLSDLGPETTDFYEGLWEVQDLLIAKFGEADGQPDIPEYSLINNDTVAVIHITGFNIDTPNEFKATLDSLPSSVVDVVVDLSYNTGGNIGAVMRIFGYMTEEQFNYHSQNPADGSAVTYYIESDYVAYEYNWYVLTSSVTFSAANMFASMAKELDIPVIGQQSSGGASSIGAFITPDGSAIMISTNNVLSTKDGTDYVSVESGVPVDQYINNVASDEQLIEAINKYK
ncbi:MAG: S41 family peptidase [Candidatus Izemoplasmatales bacterium]